MIPAQELVEHGLEAAGAAGADGCIVLVEEGSHVDVRYALNTTTTNGEHRARTVSVIAIAGSSPGTATRAGVVGRDGLEEMVRAALADARAARRPRTPSRWSCRPRRARAGTSHSVPRRPMRLRSTGCSRRSRVRSAVRAPATPSSPASRNRT